MIYMPTAPVNRLYPEQTELEPGGDFAVDENDGGAYIGIAVGPDAHGVHRQTLPSDVDPSSVRPWPSGPPTKADSLSWRLLIDLSGQLAGDSSQMPVAHEFIDRTTAQVRAA